MLYNTILIKIINHGPIEARVAASYTPGFLRKPEVGDRKNK
jgi:hypothetical protein